MYRITVRQHFGAARGAAAVLSFMVAAAGLVPEAATAQQVPTAAQAPTGAVGGMGDVNIYPKRIVIDDRRRLGTLGLYNRSTSPGDYDITLADRLMTPAGQLLDLDAVTDPELRARSRSAAGMLRWSPRRAALGGSEAQTVHVMARIAPDTAPGEYRSHFMILSVPPEGEGLSIDQAAGAAPADGIGVRIVPRFGISIPVIVRVGPTTLNVGIAGLAMIDGPQGRSLRLQLTREGTRSAFGDIAVTVPGTKTTVAEVMGVGVYTEVNGREVILPLNPKADPRSYARGSRLTVTFTDDDAEPGKVLTRQELTVP